MTYHTKQIEDLIYRSVHNYYRDLSPHLLSKSTLYFYYCLILEKMCETESKIIRTHNLRPLLGEFATLEYKNQSFFDHGGCVKSVSLQESFYPEMDEWIAEYDRMMKLITATKEFVEDVISTVCCRSDLLTLLPSIFNEHRKSQPWMINKIVCVGTESLTPEKIQQFNEKHSDILNTYKTIQLDLLTR